MHYEDYYSNDHLDTAGEGDTEAIPIRSLEDDDTVLANGEEPSPYGTWAPFFINLSARGNQTIQDNGIIYLERQNKGIKMLQICDVKRQYGCGSEDQVNCSWRLVEVTEEECKLEIDKKIVKFSFANNGTDKLAFQVVDGYEVRYVLRTDAMRLELEIELVLSTLDGEQNFSNIPGDIKLETKPGDEPYTIASLNKLLPSKKTEELHPSKKTKLDHSDAFNFSVVLIVPHNPRRCVKLVVDGDGSPDVRPHQILLYNIPVDLHEQIHFTNGYIRLRVLWGCRLGKGKGVCTGVCTCEAGEFIGFPSPSEVGCSGTDE